MIFGLTLSSSWGNGHATLWRGLAGALASKGHVVIFFERDVPYYAEHRDLNAHASVQLVLYGDWASARLEALRHVKDADAVIVTSYCPDANAAFDLTTGCVREPLLIFYDLDTPVTLARARAGELVEYLPPGGLRAFDLVLSYTGGRALDALRELLGAGNVACLYGHVDPDAHRPPRRGGDRPYDMSYLGTYARDRQPVLGELFLEPARSMPQRRFVLGGSGYPDDFPWTANIFFVRHVPPGGHPAFFGSSRLTLNVTRGAMADMGFCPSGRLFEAAACGTPVLSDDWEGMEGFFQRGSEILIAHTADDARAALSLSDRELGRIAEAARNRVLSQHTSQHRANELLALLEGARRRRDGRELPAAARATQPEAPAIGGA